MKGVRTAHRLPGALVILGVLAASIGVVGLPPAAATDQQLCTGYTGCVAAGYTDHGYGANAATMYWREYPGHNCTNYAAYVMTVVNKAPTPTYRLGNASEWAAAAAAHGVLVDSTPALGSVAFWTPNTEGVGSAGHVAVVEKIDAGSLTVSDDAFSGDFHWDQLTPGGYYPSAFIHFKDWPTTQPPADYRIAFQSHAGSLSTFSSSGTVTDWSLPMPSGTSPSIARMPGGYAMALEAPSSEVIVQTTETVHTQQGMMPGTSPAIATSPSGGYMVAFQANNGRLYTYSSSSGPADLRQGMMPGTSPSIAAVPGGYEMAFQANTGELIAFGSAGNLGTRQGMMSGTSPAIAASSGGAYQVAFQANNGTLYTYSSSAGPANLGQGMMGGTSPGITAVAKGYEMAFQANTGELIAFGSAGNLGTGQGMMPGTSPGIGSYQGGFEVGFQANVGRLFRYSSPGGPSDLGQAMAAGTSPGVGS